MHGGGNILNKLVNFGFKVDNLPSGHMNYQDDGENNEVPDGESESDRTEEHAQDPGPAIL